MRIVFWKRGKVLASAATWLCTFPGCGNGIIITVQSGRDRICCMMVVKKARSSYVVSLLLGWMCREIDYRFSSSHYDEDHVEGGAGTSGIHFRWTMWWSRLYVMILPFYVFYGCSGLCWAWSTSIRQWGGIYILAQGGFTILFAKSNVLFGAWIKHWRMGKPVSFYGDAILTSWAR